MLDWDKYIKIVDKSEAKERFIFFAMASVGRYLQALPGPVCDPAWH